MLPRNPLSWLALGAGWHLMQDSALDVSWIHVGSKGQILSFVLDFLFVLLFGHFLGGYLER